jgi:thioredoxin 1
MTKAVYLEENNFDQIISQEHLVVVDYTASWCGPCRLIAPLMDQLAQEYQGRVKVIKIDVDKYPANAKQYGIRSLPTVLIFKDGQIVETIVGRTPYETFSNALEKHLLL